MMVNDKGKCSNLGINPSKLKVLFGVWVGLGMIIA
jgi:hypothetical protein